MGARFYDSALGRWLSTDTIVPDPGSSQSYNRYAYVRNSPLNFVDPTGHMEDGECGPWNEYCEGPSPPSPPTDVTTWELFLLWLLEELPETTIMDEQYDLTQQVMHIEGVNRAREEFYRRMEAGTLANGTDHTHPYRFLLKEYAQEAFTALLGQPAGSALGSFVAHVHLNDDDTVAFTVTDPKNLSSATKNPLYFVPDYLGKDVARSEHSWEGILTGRQEFLWPSDIFMRSILEPRSRGAAGPGGSILIRFTWTESLRVEGSDR